MRKCIICQEKRVIRPEYYYCPDCYRGEFRKEIKWSEKILKVLEEHDLRNIFWNILWIFGLRKETRKQERRNIKEEAQKVNFGDSYFSKDERKFIADDMDGKVYQDYLRDEASE